LRVVVVSGVDELFVLFMLAYPGPVIYTNFCSNMLSFCIIWITVDVGTCYTIFNSISELKILISLFIALISIANNTTRSFATYFASAVS
jgi:hypothetical protein